ncbi:SGNH/GDSL hydrolase family protein [Sphingobium xenophagum]|uniref:SGNH/GDSL hydrolase family protein n=1 Tax=Sphingobium xenophagum TaxID=121428 RepID=UPI0002D657D3|nr:SGNH/GDSL hydrolase family protein [Sphingobium xenophagum]
MTTTIIINRRDFNGSPVCLNGRSIPLPIGTNFEASDELLVLLANAKVRYTIVTAQGDTTGKIIIPVDGPYGGRLPLTINGKTYFLAIGEPFTPLTGVTEALANAKVPFVYERTAAVSTWMAAATRGEVATSTGSTGANPRFICRTRHYLGKGTYSALRFVYGNYFVGTSNSETGSVAAATLFVGVEIPGAPIPVVELKWSGAGTVNMAGGAPWVESDVILPSQFGLTAFAPGTEIWLRPARDNITGDIRVFNGTVGSVPGEAAYTCPTSGAGTDQHMGTGPLTLPTGGGANTNLYMPLLIKGLSASHGKTEFFLGNSLAYGQGEGLLGANDGEFEGGMLRKAAFALGLPWSSVARPATSVSTYIMSDSGVPRNAKRALLYPYFSDFYDDYGTNDLGNTNTSTGSARTATQILADRMTMYDQILAANPSAKIHPIKMTPRVSAGSYANVPASQVPVGGYATADVGGRTDVNNGLVAAIGTHGIVSVVDTSTNVMADATLTDRIAQIGGSPGSVDGLHATSAMYLLMKEPVRLDMAA